MQRDTNLYDVITAYRKVVDNRYDYNNIIAKYDIPSTFTRDKFDALRAYFLDYIYPAPDQRAQLNAAFESLDGHMANPKYLLNILMDSLGILFKYGIHLPKILMTGLKAMNSFKKAANFEKQLAHAADRSDLIAPFSKNDIEYLTAQLPREHVNGFIEDSLDLFKTLHDRKLVKRIIDIVNQLIIKMDARPNIYSIEEVQGLKLGRNLIEKGDALFESLTTKEQDILFDMVVDIERDVLDRIFKIQ